MKKNQLTYSIIQVMKITIFLFLLSISIVYGGLLFPQKLLIQKNIEINSSASTISKHLYDLPKWEKWLNWQPWQPQQNTDKYTYSEFAQGVGAFMDIQTNDREKVQLYIQSISKTDSTLQADFQKLKYIANFETQQTHLEGEFELKPTPKNSTSTTLNFTLEINLGENPFLRYVAYLYYKSKIEQETQKSLERLKKLCEQ